MKVMLAHAVECAVGIMKNSFGRRKRALRPSAGTYIAHV